MVMYCFFVLTAIFMFDLGAPFPIHMNTVFLEVLIKLIWL